MSLLVSCVWVSSGSHAQGKVTGDLFWLFWQGWGFSSFFLSSPDFEWMEMSQTKVENDWREAVGLMYQEGKGQIIVNLKKIWRIQANRLLDKCSDVKFWMRLFRQCRKTENRAARTAQPWKGTETREIWSSSLNLNTNFPAVWTWRVFLLKLIQTVDVAFR